MMISLKSIQTTFSPTRTPHLYPNRPLIHKPTTFLCLCKSESDDSSSEPSPTPEGDTRKQDLLARIAMLQAQKVRLTDYLDERSAYLTQFAEEANAEFDKIGEDALKGLDEAGDRIRENIESKMQAFEETMEMNRQEIDENENKLVEIEDQMERDRNEGLFFQSLRPKPHVEIAKAKKEAEKIRDVAKENAGSRTRRNIYLALIGVLVVSIADSFISSPDWRKVAVLGAILVGLVTQFSYEQSLLSETEKKEKGKSD